MIAERTFRKFDSEGRYVEDCSPSQTKHCILSLVGGALGAVLVSLHIRHFRRIPSCAEIPTDMGTLEKRCSPFVSVLVSAL